MVWMLRRPSCCWARSKPCSAGEHPGTSSPRSSCLLPLLHHLLGANPVFDLMVHAMVVPMLLASGLAMWLWPRARRLLRRLDTPDPSRCEHHRHRRGRLSSVGRTRGDVGLSMGANSCCMVRTVLLQRLPRGLSAPTPNFATVPPHPGAPP